MPIITVINSYNVCIKHFKLLSNIDIQGKVKDFGNLKISTKFVRKLCLSNVELSV